MEPLSAFALASSVLQVVELGVKVIWKATEYRNSDSAYLAEHGDLKGIADSLSNMNYGLSASLKRQIASREAETEELYLIRANEECLRISESFVTCLDDLKVKDKRTIFDSVRMSLKALWHKERIESMEKTVSQARNNLNVALLVFINSKQATRAAQDELYEQSSLVEHRILGAVSSSSSQLQDDIKSLSTQINNLNLDAKDQAIREFAALHADILERLSIYTSSATHIEQNGSANTDSETLRRACHNITNSLHFPQITERQEQTPKAYMTTYRWILEPRVNDVSPLNSFIDWLRNPSCEHRIFWLHGKIGAGKTVLMRFLDENLNVSMHMLPWAEKATVLKASYFFWSGGNKLQKSFTGFLRTLLFTVFEQMPELLPKTLSPRKWQMAVQQGKRNIEWTESELLFCLKNCISLVRNDKKFFFLLDGLDEMEGTEESHTALLDLISHLSSAENVKICLSSRPWNIFHEAFWKRPQLKLETLTRSDIMSYVTGQLHGSRHFQRLSEFNKSSAALLVEKKILKASGVFLWVRLVILELLQGLRDGDGMSVLHEKVEGVPEDLETYFAALLESIKPSNRLEASTMFQIALYREESFISLHANCLLDFSFVEHRSPNFALGDSNSFQKLDFTDKSSIAFRLDSTLRKLNSRCLGLLECHEDTDKPYEVQDFEPDDNSGEDVEISGECLSQDLPEWNSLRLKSALDLDDTNALRAAGWVIEFTHRSVRDFLFDQKIQSRLHQYSNGQVDVRLYMLNARIVELVALCEANIYTKTTVGLASYILSCVANPVYRNTVIAMRAADKIRPIFEKLVHERVADSAMGWYIDRVLRSWHKEKSNFLTVVIDYGLIAYIRHHLTPQSLKSKIGRPILDYILRPRFIGFSPEYMCVGNQLPNLELLKIALSCGANPNEIYEDISVWAMFLCFMSDYFRAPELSPTVEEEIAFIDALGLLLNCGTQLLLPRDWMHRQNCYDTFAEYDWLYPDPTQSTSEYIESRFSGAKPAIPGCRGRTAYYRVSNLLEGLGTHLRCSLEPVKSLALQREIQELAWIS